MSRRIVSTIAIAMTTFVVSAVFVAGTASAQNAVAVAQGASFTVENANECAPGADVAIFFTAGIGTPERIGATIADANGHFATEVALSDAATLGPATVTVECGISGSVLLYDIVVVEAAGFDPMAYAPYAVGVLVLILAVAVVVGRRERSAETGAASTSAPSVSEDAAAADAPDGSSIEAAPADVLAGLGDTGPEMVPEGGASAVAPAPEASEDDAAPSAAATWAGGQQAGETAVPDSPPADDGADASEPDYWIWDVDTERGPAKRLACLSQEAFFLHEVPESAFNPLLELLAAVGPEEALASAFMRISIDDIHEVRTRGTMVRITYRGPEGPVVRTLDLAGGSQGVVDLLSTRVPVIADNPQAATTS